MESGLTCWPPIKGYFRYDEKNGYRISYLDAQDKGKQILSGVLHLRLKVSWNDAVLGTYTDTCR